MRAPPKREGMRTDGAMAATEVLHNEPRQGSGLGADGLSLAQPRKVKKCVCVCNIMKATIRRVSSTGVHISNLSDTASAILGPSFWFGANFGAS